jgi:beta-lactamase regulating signal transducer with metallopeptidase domain
VASTVLIGLAWLLTVALRRNRASIRHWIWLCASLKFVFPFSVLVGIGSHLALPTVTAIAQSRWAVIERVGEPFVGRELSMSMHAPGALIVSTIPQFLPWFLLGVWFVGSVVVGFYWVVSSRRLGALVGDANPLREGRELDALRRMQQRQGWRRPVRLASSISSIEPGVRGLVRAVLLLPAGIGDRLNDAQLEAIIAHELAHARRRDNLTAAIHRIVETILWFHPLVWWIGSRLVDERERSCDEEVLQLGSSAETYAEAILAVCEFYLAAPSALLSGITSSNLKMRIEEIMTHRLVATLDAGKKLLLAIAGIAVVATPILVGVMNASQVKAQAQAAQPPELETFYNNIGTSYQYIWQSLQGRRSQMSEQEFEREKERILSLALEAFSNAIAIKTAPPILYPLDSFVDVLHEMGKDAMVEPVLTARFAKSDYRVTYAIGKVAWLNGDYKTAIAYFEAAEKQNPDKLMYFIHAYALDKLGQREQAIDKYLMALRQDPLFKEARYNLALVYDEKDQDDANNAISNLQDILGMDANYPLAHMALARIHLRHGDLQQGCSQLRDVLRIQPNHQQGLELWRRSCGSSTKN